MNTRRGFIKIIALLLSALPFLGRFFPDVKCYRIRMDDRPDIHPAHESTWVSALNFDIQSAYSLGYSKFNLSKDGEHITLLCSERTSARPCAKHQYARSGVEWEKGSDFVAVFNHYSEQMSAFGQCGIYVIPNETAENIRLLAFRNS
jgi:hypothetical protein